MQINKTTIDFRTIRRFIDSGQQVILFIRHSERPPISTTDKSFGKNLGLTEYGIEMCHEAGSRFSGLMDVDFYASPMERCRRTAKHFAEGMGLPDSVKVSNAPQIGIEGFYMHPDYHALQTLMKERGYMEYMEEYLNNGTAPYLNNIHSSTEKTIEWMQSVSKSQFSVFVSHDIYITAFITSLGIRTFHGGDWIGFLHAAALCVNPENGEINCYHAVPCLESHKEPATFFQ